MIRDCMLSDEIIIHVIQSNYLLSIYSAFRDGIMSKQAQLVLCAAKAFNARLLDAQTFNTSDLLMFKSMLDLFI